MRKLGRKLYFGIVEENVDPRRAGRIKVRVQSVYNEIPTEDIPWAHPFNSVSGKDFQIPAKGKIVTVLFFNDDIYVPHYIFSENYNINLNDKLNSLTDDEYLNFISLLFDHTTQIYTSDNNLTIDYLFNKITIDKGSVNVELKNDSQKFNLGSAKADQQALLSNHWFDWFDKFMKTLAIPTSMIDSISAPIVRPDFDQLCQEYEQIKDTFKSKNVYIVDNSKVGDKNESNRERSTQTIIHDKDLLINSQNALTYKDPDEPVDSVKRMTDSIINETAAEKDKVDDSTLNQSGNDQDVLTPKLKITDINGNTIYEINKGADVSLNGTTVVIVDTNQTIKLDYPFENDALVAKNNFVSMGLIDKTVVVGGDSTDDTRNLDNSGGMD